MGVLMIIIVNPDSLKMKKILMNFNFLRMMFYSFYDDEPPASFF